MNKDANPVEAQSARKLVLGLFLGAAVLALGACEEAGEEGAAPTDTPAEEESGPTE